MPQLNIEQARFNMVEQQIRPWDVLDQRVLDLISQVPREEFVPMAYRNLAFADIEIPLGHDQIMMSPKLEGRILQTLLLNPKETVLEIGTGSGYFTALLAKSAQHVESVDIVEDFVKTAAEKLKAFHIHNVSLQTNDAMKILDTETQYDVIVFTGSVPVLEPQFYRQLKIGGCLFAIVGEEPIMQAQLVNRITDKEFEMETLFETSLPPLIGVPEPDRFVF
jgi:protein-L-isoaspartate(D-aspartate) O-methyltransferase